MCCWEYSTWPLLAFIVMDGSDTKSQYIYIAVYWCGGAIHSVAAAAAAADFITSINHGAQLIIAWNAATRVTYQMWPMTSLIAQPHSCFSAFTLRTAATAHIDPRPTPVVMTMFRDPVLRVTLIAKHIVDDGDFATIKRKIKSWHSYKCIGLSP